MRKAFPMSGGFSKTNGGIIATRLRNTPEAP